MQNKIKVMAWMDYCANTGFGVLASNIWKRLYKTGKYELDVIGINFTGDPYDHEKWPGKVYTALSGLKTYGNYGDYHGRQKLIDFLGQGDYDIFWCVQDTFILQTIMKYDETGESPLLLTQQHKNFDTIFYYPIDAIPSSDWITDTVSNIDYPVAYTQFALEESIKIDPKLEDKLRVIYHGIDPEVFHPVEDKVRKEFRHNAYRGAADNRFLIVNVNRNQRRKDILRSLLVLKELKDRGHKNDFVCYFHMAANDVGGNLFAMAEQLGLEINKDYLVPDNFDPHDGFPEHIVNLIYNSADCILTTTHSEGFGFCAFESFATRVPIVAPDNTSLTELLADNRGYLVRSGWNNNMWVQKDQDNDRIRALMDVEQAADRILDIYNGKPPDVEGAYNWVLNYTWDNVAKEWEYLLDKVIENKPKINPNVQYPKRRI